MSLRLRKLIGTVALLVLVSIWALAAMALAQFPLLQSNQLVAGIYYVLAGLGWVLPAMPLVKWMTADGRQAKEKNRKPDLK
jgi:uncharacterized membrane protein